MKKTAFFLLIICIAFFFIYLWKTANQKNIIMDVFSISSLPDKFVIRKFNQDSFMDNLIESEFIIERDQVVKMLVGRNWIKVVDVNEIITMEGALEGYTWNEDNKHAEFAVFPENEKVLCKLIYHESS